MRLTKLLLALTLAAPLGAPLAAPLGAQVAPAARPDTTPDGRTVSPVDTQRVRKTLFTYRDGLLAAGFAGLTVAMFPLDEQLARRIKITDTGENSFIDRAATSVEYITTPGAFFIGGGLYLGGKILRNKDMSDIGWHGVEAVLLSSLTTSILKGTLGRGRPDFVGESRPRDFEFGSGFGVGDRQSFPSGHTTTAFAAASAVTSEVNRLWPQYRWYAGTVLYGGAALVGVSRMYHNRHWASDVALGAAIGTFGGLKTVRYSHSHPDNFVDRFILGLNVVPDLQARGGTVGFSFQTK